MPISYTQLHTELTTDPSNNGYAPYLAVGNLNPVVALLNSFTAPGAGTVTMPVMDTQSFVTAFLPYLATALELAAPKGQFYSVLWQTILAMPTINLTLANIQGLLAQAVADDVLTSAQASALNHRTGTTAEVRWGAGTVVLLSDVSAALTA